MVKSYIFLISVFLLDNHFNSKKGVPQLSGRCLSQLFLKTQSARFLLLLTFYSPPLSLEMTPHYIFTLFQTQQKERGYQQKNNYKQTPPLNVMGRFPQFPPNNRSYKYICYTNLLS